jgi:hypothetical protein
MPQYTDIFYRGDILIKYKAFISQRYDMALLYIPNIRGRTLYFYIIKGGGSLCLSPRPAAKTYASRGVVPGLISIALIHVT